MTIPDDANPAVLLVGHCGFDSGGLTRQAQSALPGAHVQTVNRQTDLTELLTQAPCLLLVNRVLDGAFETSSGIDLIASLSETSTVSLLISNYDDAQQSAEDSGAAPGFGKSDIGSPKAAERLQDAAAQLTA